MQLTPEKARKFSVVGTCPKYVPNGEMLKKIPTNPPKFNPTIPNNTRYFLISSITFDSESVNSNDGHYLPKDNLASLICWSGDHW